MLNILAFARIVSIEKIDGMIFLKSRIKIACFSAWVVIVAPGIAYVVYLLLNNMGAHNNMCILLGIPHLGNITLLEHILQIVYISINMMLMITMMISIIGIFHTVLKSYRRVMKTSGQHVKSQEGRLIHTGLKLFVLLTCNGLAWLPFLIVSTFLLG